MTCGVVILAVARTCAVPKLLTLALLLTPNVPVMFAPVVVAIILAVPATVVLTLPFSVGIATLDVPFTSEVPIERLVNPLPSPEKKLAVTRLPKLALPEDRFPVTASEVNVPTLVIFG